ncbi:hypothetical protein FGIG_07149 [Fasciola gigantica]|uniref:DIX domain-containing protein n=1 Tax=Fasciola gigantica TaxID=46835 RepID=A0A504YGZ7_FASGI|nr:hypothetical protein FGIG_07149 [Fasciola gigantica]
MLQSTLESTLSQLNLTVSELEKMPKSLQPEEALFTGDGNEKNVTELAEQNPNCSSNVNNNSSPLKVPGCEEQLTTNKFKLHPRLEQFHWARQLFAEAARLSDRTMTRPDAILDEHLTRVWPRRAREMTREDRIMDDSSQTQFGWPYRFRRRRGTCREPHSQPSQASGVTAVVPQIPHYIEEPTTSNVDTSPNTTLSQHPHLDHIPDLSTVECSPEDDLSYFPSNLYFSVAVLSEDEQQCNGSFSVTTSLSDFIDCEVYVSEQSQQFILGSSLIPRPNRAVSARKFLHGYFFKCCSNEFPPGLVYEEVRDDSTQIPLWDGRVWGKVEYC